jgi:hypothetical protein
MTSSETPLNCNDLVAKKMKNSKHPNLVLESGALQPNPPVATFPLTAGAPNTYHEQKPRWR